MAAADPRHDRTRRDVATGFAAQLFSSAVAGGVAVLAARELGPTGNGALQVAQSTAATGGQLFSLGVGISAVRLAAQRRGIASVVSLTAASITATIGVAVVGVVMALADPLGRILLRNIEDASWIIRGSALLGVLYALQPALLAGLRGLNRFVQYNALVTVGRLATAGALVTVVMVSPDPWPCLLGVVAANGAFVVGVTSWLVVRARAPRLDRRLVQPLLTDTAPAYAGTVVQEASYRADVFLLAGLAAADEVGHYAVALVVAEVMWFFPNAVGMVLLPRASADSDGVGRLLRAMSTLTMVMVAAAVAVATIAPWGVPTVFGDDYEASVAPLLILLPGIAGLGVWKALINDLVGRGHPQVKLTSAAVGAVFIVGLDLLLIPELGARGAAAASSVGYVASAAVALRSASRILEVPIRSFVVPRRG